MGFLGIAVMLFNFLGFSYSIKSATMIALGLAVSFISFRGIVKDKFLARMKKFEEKMMAYKKTVKKRLIKKDLLLPFLSQVFVFLGLVFHSAE